MIIYIVTQDIYYSSGISILGVFKSFKDAEDMRAACDSDDEPCKIEKYEVIE